MEIWDHVSNKLGLKSDQERDCVKSILLNIIPLERSKTMQLLKKNYEMGKVESDEMEKPSCGYKLFMMGLLFSTGVFGVLIGVISFITDRVLQHISVGQSVIVFLVGLIVMGIGYFFYRKVVRGRL